MSARARPRGRVILVKHAPPEIRPDVPSPRWELSAEGVRRCAWLADALAREGATRLASSPEPKALRTAELVASRLGLEPEVHPGLAENDRHGFPYLPYDAWQARFVAFFAEPKRRSIGRESADEASARFEAAVAEVVAERDDATTAIVAHGTVITLFVARRADVDPFELWGRLGLPSYVVLERSVDSALRWDGHVHNHPDA